jgi:S-adenosylmethionine synthetase
VRKHFENFGAGYNKSPQKVTPKAIFISPRDAIKAYLKGLFDSDGTIVSNTGRKRENIRVRVSSSSYKLLEETQLLLNEFAIKATILFNSHKETAVGKNKKYKSKYDNFVLSLVGFESYQNFGKEIGFFSPSKAERMEKYLKSSRSKPKNSPSIYLVPHPKKKEMVGEELIGKKLPFALTNVKKKVKKPKTEVYDLEVEEVNIFSANGIFVHNSMFGYATNETKELMPLPIMLAHALTKRLATIRKQKKVNYLRPDGKSQVTVEYHDGQPKRVDAIVLSAHHASNVEPKKLEDDLKRLVVRQVIPKKFMDKNTKIYINPTGAFEKGGPLADTGVTGRKIIIDTYGGVGSHGGGCFSGKDPTKVDRSASYYARYIAKNVVASGLADKCEIQLAYAIGVAEPVSLMVNTFETSKVSEEKIKKIIKDNFDTRPKSIIKELQLRQPIYRKTACYGHFGRENEGFKWEETDKADILKKSA